MEAWVPFFAAVGFVGSFWGVVCGIFWLSMRFRKLISDVRGIEHRCDMNSTYFDSVAERIREISKRLDSLEREGN